MPGEHGGGASLGHGHAKFLQLADDAPVAPARVLPRQTADELDRLTRQGWPTGASVREGPLSPQETVVPVEDRSWRDEERPPSLTRQKAG